MTIKITKIYQRDGTIVPFNQEKITNAIFKAAAEVGGRNKKLAKSLSDKVIDVLENHFPKTIPSVEEIQDIIEQVLIKNGHDKTAKAFILYRQRRRELREKKENKEVENIPYETIYYTLVWNLDHSCETIEKLNKYVKDKTLPKLIKATEQAYEEEIINIASTIKDNLGKIKVFIVSGPSASGKTTTTNRLGQKLKKKNINFVKFNIDNYFYNLRDQLKDSFNDYDFEGPYALELSLINEHLTQLLAGKKVKVPRYSFKLGRRLKETDDLRLKKNEILLIDSHFGIYDKLTESIPRENKYKLYLETLCQLRDKDGQFVRWTDIRMLRRMIRDVQFRGHNPIETVGHWHYVRKAELKNIIAYNFQADYILNTSLAYELPILKHYLFHYFPSIIKTYKKDSKREDAYIRAQRVYNLLCQIKEWQDSSVVPRKSILREFIGNL